MLLNGLICNKIRNKKKSEKSFAGIWLAHVLALFLNENPLSLIISSHFPLSPSSPARTSPGSPRKLAPLAPVREPCPAGLVTVAGLRGQKLSDCTALTIARGEPRLNTEKLGSHNSDYVQSSQNSNPRSRLKTRTPHASRHASRQAGAGAHLAARFFPIIHHTPPKFFSQ